jgi:hypothetical protein
MNRANHPVGIAMNKPPTGLALLSCLGDVRGRSEAYPRAVSTRPRWPIAVFVVAMAVAALAIGRSADFDEPLD